MNNQIKNSIYIDIDTEREKPILFSKPPSIEQPKTPSEAAKMILLDIGCLAEALTTLIYIAGEYKYGDKNELINASIKTLYGALQASNNDSVETPISNEPQTNS